MTMKTGLAGLLASALVFGALVSSANAASVETEAFLANVRPNVDFLDRSSRLALTQSANPRLRAFARNEAIEQTITANSLVAWSQTNTTRGAVGAVAPDGTIVTAPVALATVPVQVGEDVLTGRSVALDVPVPVAPNTSGATLLPAGQTDLDRLTALKGRRFDALYRSTQADALRQLQTLYASYIQNGDDPDLRAMARIELPKINKRIVELNRL
jgi:predicted outer membrane protein